VNTTTPCGEAVATASSSKPSALRSPAAIARASASAIRCAGIPATRCAMLKEATPTSLPGVSSTAPPVTATRALANTSPGKPP
jgi:hypothetical protein